MVVIRESCVEKLEIQQITSSIKCDRIIFMPASIGGRGGYQIVAKSDGVRNDEFEFIESYGIPVALNPKIFEDGRRLFVFPSGRLGVNFIHNIGTGYDGRTGAIYSETIIIDKESFLKTKGDPNLFEALFLKNYSLGLGNKVERLELLQIPESRSGDMNLSKLAAHTETQANLETIIRGLLDPEKRLAFDCCNVF